MGDGTTDWIESDLFITISSLILKWEIIYIYQKKKIKKNNNI